MHFADRRSVTAMLAGSLFALGLPCLWYLLTEGSPSISQTLFLYTRFIDWWYGIFIVGGLALLAISLWVRAKNPYGSFALGLLLSGIGIFLDLTTKTISFAYFPSLAVLYIVAYVFARKTDHAYASAREVKDSTQ